MNKRDRLPSLETISPIIPRYTSGKYTIVKLEGFLDDKQARLTRDLLDIDKDSPHYESLRAKLTKMEDATKIRYDLSPNVTDNTAPERMKMYIYKVYNDEYAYGEESIQLFASKKDAINELKKDVSEYYEMPFEDIEKNEKIFDKESDIFSEDYVSISEDDHCLFWIVEEHYVA